jgi:putative protease
MDHSWMEELCKISHRGYTTGFLLGKPTDTDHEYDSSYRRNHEFVGTVEDVLPNGAVLVGVRNRIEAGEEIDFISRRSVSALCRLDSFTDMDGTPLMVANPNQRIIIKVPFPTERYDLLRREKRQPSHHQSEHKQ